jgi:hypothetical protein
LATLNLPTLQELITESRVLLNQKDPFNSTWTDEDLGRWANEGTRRYFLEATHYAEGLFLKDTTLDITSGSDKVALPSDAFEVRALYKQISDGFIMLPYRNNLTEGFTTSGGTNSENYLPYYYFEGNSLVIRPTPNFSETGGLKIEYFAYPSVMVNGGDAIDAGVLPVFKDLIIAFIVYKAKFQEANVNGTQVHANAKMELNEQYQMFKEAIMERSKNPTAIIPFNPETEGL